MHTNGIWGAFAEIAPLAKYTKEQIEQAVSAAMPTDEEGLLQTYCFIVNLSKAIDGIVEILKPCAIEVMRNQLEKTIETESGKVTYAERKVYDYSQIPVWQATLDDIIILHELRRQIEEVAKTGGRIGGVEINKPQAETKEYLIIKQP